MDIKLLLNLLIIIILLFFNAFFVAAEFALVGVRKTKIKQLANEGNFNAKLALDAIKNIDRYIAAVQLGITIASLGIGWVGESTLAKLLLPIFHFLPLKAEMIAAHSLAVTISFALITILHVVIGELMPKSIALQFPVGTTLWVAKPMYVVTRLFAPMIFLLNGLGNILLRLLKIEPAPAHQAVYSTEELNMLIDASYKGGVLNQKEAEILQNVFKFSDLTAQDVMIPRPDMVCISIDATAEDIYKIIIDNQYTRYPVYKDNIDDIVGFLHTKDLFSVLINREEINISSLLREKFYVPETMPIEKLAQEFQKRKFQMAIVVDEFGGTSGLVTHEDVLEEIFGEVQDEFDDEECEFSKISENEYEVCGKFRIDEFAEKFGIKLDDEDITTIGGYVVKMLGRIPIVNDEVTDKYFKYTISEMDLSRIVKIKIKKINESHIR